MLTLPVLLITLAILVPALLIIRALANRHYARQRAARARSMAHHPAGRGLVMKDPRFPVARYGWEDAR